MSIIKVCYENMYHLFLIVILKVRRVEVLWVFDLDNTIYKTGEQLRVEKVPEVYLTADINAPLQQEILHKRSQGEWVLFLTARNLKYGPVTYERLYKDFNLKMINLLIVRNAAVKYKIIKSLAKCVRKVEFFDDLSYNHENGEILYYSNLIEAYGKLANVNWHQIKLY